MLLNCDAWEDSWVPYVKEIKSVNPKRSLPWIFVGRMNAEAERPILGPPDAKSWLTGKDSDAGKDWVQEEKGVTEDEMVAWHHWLNGHEFEQTPGDSEGQGNLACCSPWGQKESDTTEWLNNSNTVLNSVLLLLSRFSRVRLCATPQTAVHQAPPSLGVSRQERWSGWPFPSPIVS